MADELENVLTPSIAKMIELPPELETGIARALKSVSTVTWMREAQALSERYRAKRTGETQPLATGSAQALGYAALILPAAYAQLCGAIAATAQRIPHWQPRTMLDLGSGPGTALWAATTQWPSMRTLTAWERESSFIALGRDLVRNSSSEALRGTQWERADLRTIKEQAEQQYDLVVLGHVLNELPADAQAAIVAAAWARTAGVLLIVEPGTSAAFPVVRTSRDQLLAAGAHTIAPCVHDQPCPLQNDWCHFPQRLKRPPFQRQARGAPSEWEDSKWSYAAMARFKPHDALWARVIREPTSNKAYAEITLSSREGIVRNQAFKRYREWFRLVQDVRWGSALREPLPEPVRAIEGERLATTDDGTNSTE